MTIERVPYRFTVPLVKQPIAHYVNVDGGTSGSGIWFHC